MTRDGFSECGVDSTSGEYIPVAGFCESGNESRVLINITYNFFFQMKLTRFTLLLSIFVSTSLHISDNRVKNTSVA